MNSTKHTRALAYDILAYWERFNHHDQETWVDASEWSDDLVKTKKVNGVKTNVCSTTMCAAGTAVFINYPLECFKGMVDDGSAYDWVVHGGAALGLDYEDASLVFHSDNKSARRFMKAIASGSDKKFEKAVAKSVPL